MSTRPGSTLEAMDEMSDGAPAPVEVFPEVPDEPEPNGEDPLDVPPPNGEVEPPEEPEEPDEPDEPGTVALAAVVVEPWTGQTMCPSPMPPTMATRSTTAATPATSPRRLGAGAGAYTGG